MEVPGRLVNRKKFDICAIVHRDLKEAPRAVRDAKTSHSPVICMHLISIDSITYSCTTSDVTSSYEYMAKEGKEKKEGFNEYFAINGVFNSPKKRIKIVQKPVLSYFIRV